MLEHLLQALSKDKTKQSRVKHQGGETREDQKKKRAFRRQKALNHNKSYAALNPICES